MKQIHCLSFLLILLVTASFISCSDDDDKNRFETGITGQSWTDGTPLEISPDNVLKVKFNAAAGWTASGNSDWCNLLTTSGEKGQNTLKLSVTSVAATNRTATITIKVDGYSSTSFEVMQKASSGTTTEDMEVNEEVDQYLREMYLWNDEYKTLDLDFTKGYEDFFYNALGSMTTNTLDKRPAEDGLRYTLFSYIEKREPVSTPRNTKLVFKEPAYSFGITGMTVISIGTQNDYTTYFCIQGVYPDSPADIAGIKRGSMINSINGEKINNGNIENYYYSLLYPSGVFSLNLREDIIESGSTTGTKEINIVSKAMYCNPIIAQKVIEKDGHNIGYLVYSRFDAGFDQELFDTFKGFKSKNVTDLIIDLRYNGGGHTLSANLMATCIAGAAAQGKVFTTLRYNKERMEKLNNKREEELFAYTNYVNLGASLSAGSLGLTRVYCLVGNGTASASELVINSLRGIDIEVILIGEKTTGKNVGMEYEDVTIRNNTYRVVPITFQSYNAKGYGDYENGFTPEPGLIIDETNPFNESGRFYIHRDYATNDEPLYAKAIELITGKNPSIGIRSVEEKTVKGNVQKMPSIFRPGHDGMLKRRASKASPIS